MSRLAVSRGIGAWIGRSLVVIGGAVGIHLALLQVTGNFHAVIAGELYRSAQPAARDIDRYVTDYRIRTIINLRGNDGAAEGWHADEVEAAKRLGVAHIDFPMSASRELTQDEAARLIAIFETAAKPVLIHCKAGADRSGLAAALYIAAVAKLGEETAEAQLSIRYGHVGLPLTGSYAMDRTFEDLEVWLGFPGT